MSVIVAEASEKVKVKVSEYSFDVKFPKELTKPRWDLVNLNYYTETAAHEGTVATVPLFHVPLDVSHFSFNIRISGARFTKGMVDNPEEVLFDCVPEKNCPLAYFIDKDQQGVRIVWTGSSTLQGVPWGRWILRFLVERTGRDPESTYIGFTTMSNDVRKEVLQDLRKKGLAAANKAAASDVVKSSTPASTDVKCKLDLDIEFGPDQRPLFPTLFNQGLADQGRLPKDVYLEPMFVVRKSNVFIDFDFHSSSGLFSAALPEDCNPVVVAGSVADFAVALDWKGVQEVKSDCRTAMGFSGSWRSPKDEVSNKNIARIRWFEPDRIPDQKDEISIASFFFRDLMFLMSPESDGVLVDPTIVYEEDKAGG